MINIDYLYNSNISKAGFERSRLIDKKLGFQVIENGTILPQRTTYYNGERIPFWCGFGGIADSNGEYIPSSFALTSGTGGVYTPPLKRFNTVPKP